MTPTAVDIIEGNVTTPRGIRAAGMRCGIKPDRPDLALVVTDKPVAAAACFTTNRMAAPSVQVSRQQIRRGKAQAVVISSGNANACTGPDGLGDAWEMVDLTARSLGIDRDLVLVASTGVIGMPLPMDRLREGIPVLARSLGPYGDRAAEAILTTDAFPKTGAAEIEVGGHLIRLGGMTKGAGMIHPCMATTLCVVATDAAIQPDLLQQSLRAAVDVSFNCVTVDGDTSTNDAIFLLATGAAGNPPLRTPEDPGFDGFQEALTALTQHLARLLVKDGEGATKVVQVVVRGAASDDDARRAGEAITTSLLVKTALHGTEPNWGRVLAALGRSGAQVDADRVALFVEDVPLVRQGVGVRESMAAASLAMRDREFTLTLDMGLGKGQWTGWTCDLTEAYVRVNSGALT